MSRLNALHVIFERFVCWLKSVWCNRSVILSAESPSSAMALCHSHYLLKFSNTKQQKYYKLRNEDSANIQRCVPASCLTSLALL